MKSRLDMCGVSPQAFEKLTLYVAMITKWNKAINLVSPATIPHIWERHILDSAQLWPLILQTQKPTRIIDLGSGGGLPGLVLAMMGAEQVTMVESDQRKCVFLREVSRETGLINVTVINERINQAGSITAPIITARALASLLDLTAWASPLIEPNGVMIFPKGQDWQEEIAGLNEHFDDDFIGKIENFQSVTDTEARIILVRNI